MTLEVLAFGIARDIFSGASATIEVGEEATVGSFKKEMEAEYPQLKALASYMIAVNDEYADDHLTITSADEIAIIPPVSGG